ncbi:MAG: sensor histidine kinase, partial [Salibacteraceae bacterium]
LSKRDAELKIQRSQRNFFLALTLLLIIVISTSVFIYTNRLRINRKIADQRIAKLEKEKEVLNLQSMLFAQEDERQRIARDLHDSIGALLSAAKLHLSNIENELKNLTNISFLKSTEHVIDQAGKEVRRVAHDMMPGVLMKLGLIEGIDDFLESVRESGKTTLSFTHDQLKKRLDKKQEVMIFRIVQELVNNTMKHAEASEIKLMIHQNGTELILEYRDNGKGFYADLLQSENSFGLSGISARVNFLNGIMRLETSEGNGVHFLISIPLSVEKNETA